MIEKVLPLAITLTCITACSDMCGNSIISRTASPDDRHEALLFQRDCGATTGFTTQISIVETGASESGSGNAFIADDDHGKARGGDWGGPWAEVKWLASNHLLIRYAAKSRIFDQNEAVGSVVLSYQAIAP